MNLNRLPRSIAVSLSILLVLGFIALLVYITFADDPLQPVKEYRAKQRQQLVNELHLINPPPTFIPIPKEVNDDETCRGLDVEKVMLQVAAASYPDLGIMETYALCAELGFKPVLRRDLEPTSADKVDGSAYPLPEWGPGWYESQKPLPEEPPLLPPK